VLVQWIVLWCAAVFGGIAIIAIVGGAILYRPVVIAEAPRDVLIFAAHQDDCVIMAGEYAIAARQAGRQVRVVYLTNGDSAEVDPQSERAQRRNGEAAAAWGSLGVNAIENLGLPASRIGTESRITPEQKAAAMKRIAEIIAEAAPGTAVFVPAAGETHVDHQLLREMCLTALSASNRQDLAIFEAPEYNPYLSLARMPLKSGMYIAGKIPRVRRWVGQIRSRQLPVTGFASGARPCVLPPDAKRLEQKRQLLAQFESEGGERLVRLFGNPDLFRRIHDVRAALAERPRGYLPLGVQQVGISTLSALLFLCSMVLLVALLVIRAIAAGI
jgi:LmbE family N-acetylglucosaminyl deacetylase